MRIYRRGSPKNPKQTGDTQMASIRKEILIDANPEDVWAAVRDWGALHERLVPGFVLDTRLDGEDRIVTFFNGTVLRERLVDLDDEARRLVWSVVEGPYTHHNASAQVFPDGKGAARFVWVADLLPYEFAARTGELMEQGTNVVKKTLESRAVLSTTDPQGRLDPAVR
jgi:Polyketide cyclase / dehydrase and lipid transport